jgi:branched-chain amino acid transport system ATP-binding protein
VSAVGNATEPTDVLRTDGLEVRYGGALALADASISVASGESIAILGANGAGKSSLARACCGLVPSTNGTIHLFGTEITGWPAHRVRRSGVLYLPEGRGILPNLTVRENLRMAVRTLKGREEQRRAIEVAREHFPVLGQREGQRAGSLSGGEQQMLSLARAFAAPPRLLIADEPSLGLAPLVVNVVFESLQRLKADGVTIVLIEQRAHQALSLCDRCIVIRRGSVVWSGPAEQAEQDLLDHYMGEVQA